MRSAAPRPTAASSTDSRRSRRSFKGGRLRLLVEVEGNRRRCVGAGLGREVGLLVEAHDAGEEDRRHALDRGVIVPGELVKPAALDADAVLSPLELGLQLLEVGGRLEARVIFGYDEQ